MRERNRPPFQARVASVAIITTVAVLVAACISFMLQQWSVSRQQARTRAVDSRQCRRRLGRARTCRIHDPAALQQRRRRRQRGQARSVDVRLLDATGHTLAYYAAPPPQPRTLGPVHTASAHGDARRQSRSARSWCAATTRPSSALLPRFLALTGALFFGASGIALFVAQSLSRRVTAPIERLSKAMAQVASSGEFRRWTRTTPTTTSSCG